MDRVKHIAQKRATLKTRLTTLQNIVRDGRLDAANLKLRLQRLKELFTAYEEFNDELNILNPNDEHLDEFTDIQDRYYALATQINALANPNMTLNQTLNNTCNQPDKSRRLKLPVAELPLFNGALERWLSYKNTFKSMIDARDDLTDLQKFIYLKNSLRGDALTKISVYDVSEENYHNAWQLLVDAYEKERILIDRHLDSIIDLTAQSKLVPRELTKLIDGVRQHVHILTSLDVNIGEPLLLRLLERALPLDVRSKWEETLCLDRSPTLAQFYTFVSETAFRLKTLEQNASQAHQLSVTKRKPTRENRYKST